MRLNSLPFTEKLLRFKPKVVCFVGKKIWDVYESVIRKTATVPTIAARESEAGPSIDRPDGLGTVKIEQDTLPTPPPITPIKTVPNSSTPKATTIRQTSNGRPQAAGSARRRGQEKENPQFDWTKPRPYRLPHLNNGQVEGYTYFWVVPNTSGLERTPVRCRIVSIFLHQKNCPRIRSRT